MLSEFETDPSARAQRISFAKVVVYSDIKPKTNDNRRGSFVTVDRLLLDQTLLLVVHFNPNNLNGLNR